MTFEKAIQHCYGITFREIPADGRMRSFAIGKKEGFAMLFDGAGLFGCWNDYQAFEWRGGVARVSTIDLQRPKRAVLRGRALDHYRNIVAIGNAAQDAGRPLSGDDESKYLEALVRVIEAANG